MKHIYTYSGLFFLCFFLACGGGSAVEDNNADNTPSSSQPTPTTTGQLNYQALADAYCKCSEPTVAINKEMEKLVNTDDEAFEKLVPKADKAFKKAIACCRDAKAEQATGEINQKKLIKPLKATCPDLPEQLILKLVTEIK